MYQDMTNHGWRYSNREGWQSNKNQDKNRNWRDHSSPRGGYQRKDEYDANAKKSGDQRGKHVNIIDANYDNEEEGEENFL